MRTFIIMLAIGARMVSFAQQDTAWVIAEADPTITNDDWQRGVKTVSRIKPYMSQDSVAKYCPKCVNKYGLDSCTMKILAIFMTEGNGKFQSAGDSYGPAHVHEKDVYADYRKREGGKHGFVDFRVQELDDSLKIRYTLILLDWHIGSPGRYKYDSEEKWVRAWNGGPTGWKDHLKRKDFETEEKWQTHQEKVRNTMNYWLLYLVHQHVQTEMANLGISQFL